jgi:hypothetical protein
VASVTPSEATATDELAVARSERDQAIAHARALEHELGALRGRVKRLELVMWRRTARRQRMAGRLRRVGALLRRPGSR